MTAPALQDSKPWWHSRTIWANLAVLLLAGVETQLQVVQPLLPVNVYTLLAFALPLANLVLRTLTQQAISVGKASAGPTQ